MARIGRAGYLVRSIVLSFYRSIVLSQSNGAIEFQGKVTAWRQTSGIIREEEDRQVAGSNKYL